MADLVTTLGSTDLLAEDLFHNLGAASEGGHDLMPVDHLCSGGLVVPGQERDRLHRHTISGQERHGSVPQFPWHPYAAESGGFSDLAELPADIVVIERSADGGGEDQVVVLP
jgi:hypothetical protein